MKTVRTGTQLLIAALLAVAGGFLVAEATGAVGGDWRTELARVPRELAAPTWAGWVSAVVGLALALASVVAFAAQIAPPKKGLNKMHEVHRAHDGTTRIAGRAAIAAVRHELQQIEGVVEVASVIRAKRLVATIEVDDRADLVHVETEARSLLGAEFWINLGLADLAVDIVVIHHPNPPRVR